MFFVLLQVSYFEIYMDKIRDLLDGVFMPWKYEKHNSHFCFSFACCSTELEIVAPTATPTCA